MNACVGWLHGEPAPGSDDVFAPLLERFAEPYRPWPDDVVAALRTGDLAPLHAALAGAGKHRSHTLPSAAFALPTIPPSGTPRATPERLRSMVDAAVAQSSRPHLKALLRTMMKFRERGELEPVRDAVARLEAKFGPLTEAHDRELVREVLSFCPGRARPLLEAWRGEADLANHDDRAALLADALTRDGEHAMAAAQANALLEVDPGRLGCAAVGRLARTAMHGRDDASAELAALAAATLARLP